MTTTAKRYWLTGLFAALLVAGAVGTPSAGLRFEAAYSSGPTDVRVWMDRGYGDGSDYRCEDREVYEDWDYGDVYSSADDVVLYVRASRNCFTTVYVIDTEGFIHVIHPFSPVDNAYLVGGRMYRFYLRDYGFDSGCFGRGVAYAFAVSSPVPFVYTDYGVTIFGPRVGFQIYGDPFVAARLFYASILPGACEWGYVGVSYSRFYVREYVRYPRYLCLGWSDHHGDRGHCDGQCGAYRHYRSHAQDPYRVLRPAGGVAPQDLQYTKITRTGVRNVSGVKNNSGVKNVSDVRTKSPVAEPPARSVDRVRSTKNTFVASKVNYERMRKAYDKSGTQGAPEKAKAPVKTKTTKVAERTSNETRRVVALKDEPSKKSSSGASSRRTKL